ncbi:hypothetical protein KC332_g16570 [Hortaea werneckii]|uniref:C3H1-type domain-containing protein n=2 Tax=Hortaea werneckii TaxID=91943 RepID=A0A3M7IVY7_HORWE|nr:hypothetical protein KC350_g14245 [Hortaea werneckii]OTA28421.1 hypothetical protein BTJ68_10237 [Hortaea werneckii EXF-2000]KAI6842309.1 hypothetical protein KC358_g4074 [Hortaea werneckii]KAI6900691.1 hypothetical protein KC348_g16744 [Hortaea werneckii]KAI6941163.1 hypothetical protein KC341_g3085 [Hortaea werneckii]
MSGGFSFPPPPPPPPKPTGSSGGPEYGSQNRGGRGRGRGRGGVNRRGDGATGGARAYHSGASSYSTGYQRGGNANNMNHHTSHWQHQARGPGSFPPGININPNFRASPGSEGHAASQSQQHHEMSPSRPSNFPPRTHAGHKRKLDALRPPPEERRKQGPQTAPSIPSFGAPILPPKPVPLTLEKRQSKTRNHSNALGLTPGDRQQQQQEDFSDEEGEDIEVDEEAMYAELGSKMTFEHNGVVLSLNSEADLAAWRDERRKKWPTKARMIEKDAEKRRIGEQRRRLLASAAVLADDDESTEPQRPHNQRGGQKSSAAFADEQYAGVSALSSHSTTKDARPESALEKARRELAEQTKTLDQLRRNVAASEASLAKLRAENDNENLVASDETVARYGPAALNPGDTKTGAEDSDDSDASSEVLSESSVLTSDSEGVASGDDDDDGPPEEASTKAPAPAYETDTGVVQLPRCRYYAASGYCRDGDSCRFRHELKPGVKPAPQPPVQKQKRDPYQPKLDYSATAEKKTIYQRLLEQQEEEEDRLALQVIKHLGKTGFFGEEDEGKQAP